MAAHRLLEEAAVQLIADGGDMAALLGALPLALGFGEGAELRRPLGITIFGGLLVSQVLTLYTTPVIYLYLDRFRLWCLRIWNRRPGQHIGIDAQADAVEPQ